MAQSKHTRKSLLASGLSLLTCVALLIGSTFAWFTDSVTSGRNQITAGNLDVELYAMDNEGSYQPVSQNESLFDDKALWEPGHTEVVYLKVKNAGTLALKYQLAVTVANETPGTNVDGETFNLSDYLMFGAVEGQNTKFATRDAALAAVPSATALNDYTKSGNLAAEKEEYVALVVYMPEGVGNEANYKTGTTAPSIQLGVSVAATQDTVESDSFGTDYDANAQYDKIYVDNGDGTYTQDGQQYVFVADQYIAVTPDASVQGLYTDESGNAYTGSEEAVKASFQNSSKNITLIQDVQITNTGSYGSGTPDTYILTDDAVIDLNGKTITVNSNDRFMLAGDNIVFKNGVLKAGPMSGSATGKISYTLGVTAGSKNVVIENVVCEGGIEALGTSTVELRNVDVTATNYYAVYLAGGATVTVESGAYTNASNMVHFYTQTADCNVIVNGGTFSGGTPTHAGSGTFTNNIG